MEKLLKDGVRLKVSRKLFYLVIVPGLILAIVVVTLLIQWLSSAPETVKTKKITLEDTIDTFYTYLEHGDLDRARLMMTVKYFRTDQVSLVEANRLVMNMLKSEQVWAQKSKVKVLEENVQGDYAYAKLSYMVPEQEKTYQRYIFLVREGNAWTIAGVGQAPPTWNITIVEDEGDKEE